MNRRAKQQSGFTLLEVMLSVAIIAVLSGLSLPLYESFVRRNDLDLTTQTIVAAIRRAETYARANNGDSLWGVSFQAGTVTLYKGASYATRTSGFDEAIALPGLVTISGLSDINFSKLSAAPSSTGTVTLTSSTNDSRILTINAKGMVAY